LHKGKGASYVCLLYIKKKYIYGYHVLWRSD
jgi:hypothetical protein